jgi:biopolymer transport protein ExbD
MVRQLGNPTFFVTLTSADMLWPDMIQVIARQFGENFTDEQVREMSSSERLQWLRRNPVTAARHFDYRLNLFINQVIKSRAEPIGHVTDYCIRIEFQQRGSPHAHMLFWVRDSPKLNIQTDQEIVHFIDKYVTCSLPDNDPEMKEKVAQLQKHNHSNYCRKKKTCRFGYPKPPSNETMIAREPPLDEHTDDILKQSREILKRVKEAIENEELMRTCTDLNSLLRKLQLTPEMYREALSVSTRNTTVVLRRTLQEKCVNPYNETLLKAWGANLDIQYIIDVYAVIMYIAAYITKSEKNMGQLLREVAKQCRDEDISIQLKKIGSTFLNKREVSAQEVAYRLLSIPLRKFSRSVVFVNTDKKIERAGKLKSAAQLSNKDDDDEDIFETSLIDRYAARPDSLEKICLATFASQYSTKYEQESGDNDRDDAPREANDDGDENSQNDRQNCNERIQLKHGLGRMIKRKRECVIRFRRLHREKEPEDFF